MCRAPTPWLAVGVLFDRADLQELPTRWPRPYGIAVTGVMVISTTLVAVVARYHWKWSRPAVIAVFGALG